MSAHVPEVTVDDEVVRPSSFLSRIQHVGIWPLSLAAILLLCMMCGFRPGIPGSDAISEISTENVSRSESYGIRMPIEDIRVGNRVLARNPLFDEEDRSHFPDIDPAAWRHVTLQMEQPNGEYAHLRLLRPMSWLRQLGASINESCEIELPELCLRGNGRLVAIEPCPELTGGDGSVVTGTFELSSRAILNLSVDDSPTPLGVTPNHPIWSEDRRDFVPACQLRVGEHVKTLNGIARVRAISSVSRAAPVYNLEVLGEHVYHVGGNGLLVHNNSWKVPNSSGPNLRTGVGYDASDPPVRIEGPWTLRDMERALYGHPPESFGRPDLHHGGQMLGGSHHEIAPPIAHRQNPELHRNLRNQGVTADIRESDRQLHWWYRAREQGATDWFPFDVIYEKGFGPGPFDL